MKILFATALISTLLFIEPSAFVGQGTSAAPDLCKDRISFQILTDKRSYAPGAIVQVRAVISNPPDGNPIYLFRNMARCSSPFGWFELKIKSSTGYHISTVPCFVHFNADQLDLLATFRDERSVIAIRPGEIYGKMLELEAPKQAGVYQLEGEIMPPALTRNQSDELLRQNKRVLETGCRARVVILTVK